MYSQLMGLLLALLLSQFAILADDAPGIGTPVEAWLIALVSYGVSLTVFMWQGRSYLFRRYPLCIQLEILVLLGCYLFILAIQRPFSFLPLPMTALVCAILMFYSGAIAAYYYGVEASWSCVWRQLRLLLPLAIPYLLLTLYSDVSKNLSSEWASVVPTVDGEISWVNTGTGILLFLAMLAAIPVLVVRLWGCTPLADGPLKKQLENLCKHANFRHGGILVWHAMGDISNAAIVGFLPSMRYIILSPGLLKELSPEDIEAVLAHEIGHNFHHHLLQYPIILLGMAAVSALVVQWVAPALNLMLTLGYELYPSYIWNLLPSPLLFVVFALVTTLYFRYVFGFFSRSFERQADLYGSRLGLPLQQMINSLDNIACANGYNHHAPSWHHGSIAARIRFLKSATAASSMIYQRRMRLLMGCYVLAVTVAIALLLYPQCPSDISIEVLP
jgi:Zn-dependent protease with chaperone function